MTEHIESWVPTAPLPTGRPILIEASAGTGKTYQMASLVVRLVAEEDLPIHEILVITFTNAAAAELRDRVRGRLVEARDVLAGERPPRPGDEVVETLLGQPEREVLRARLAAALSDFDRAPISTIHGFSQRMLDQLAFESGQEPGLELLTDARPIVREVVEDAVARIYGRATEAQIAVLEAIGFDRSGLTALAREMSQAVAPELVPEGDPDDPQAADPFTALNRWAAETERFRDWTGSDEFSEAYEAYVHEATRDTRQTKKSSPPPRMINTKSVGQKRLDGWLDDLRAWLASGAPLSGREDGGVAKNAVANLRLAKYEAVWLADLETRDAFAGRALFEGCDRFFDRQLEIWGEARASFAAQVRGKLAVELERRGLLTFDTMLSRLAERIEAESAELDGPLATAIRGRFQAALVDEFQDTDHAQWTVLKAVFIHEDRRLIVVGDPKQAIYAFRGADVHVYLDAARTADRATMTTNWRSDGPLVEALNAFWRPGSNAFDVEQVPYVRVQAQPDHRTWRLRSLPDVFDSRPDDAPGDTPANRCRRPLELRWLDGTTLGAEEPYISNKDDGEAAVAAATAREAARLLERDAGSEIYVGKKVPEEDAEGWRRLRPGDIAVLVRKNAQGEMVRRELAKWGIPAVSAGRGSVFQSAAATWIGAFLDALAQPGRDAPARVLATTPLVGWTAQELAASLEAAEDAREAAAGAAHRPVAPGVAAVSPMESNEDANASEPKVRDWSAWIARIAKWADRWSTRGFVRVFEEALDGEHTLVRLLRAPDGERLATDVRHLAELCHAEERRARLGPAALASWLRERVSEANEPRHEAGDEAALRLESDARAVQIVTVHKSKGLEYPVVLLPFAWNRIGGRGDGPIRYHAEIDGESRLRLDVHPKGAPARVEAEAAKEVEGMQEDLRLLYVALTRAAHHVVAWLGPIGSDNKDPSASPIGRLALRPLPDSDDAATPEERLAALAASSDIPGDGHGIGWSREGRLGPVARITLEDVGGGTLAPLPWKSQRDHLGSSWQVASYSSMVAGRTHDDEERVRTEDAWIEAARKEAAGASGREDQEATADAAAALDEPSAEDVADARLLERAPLADLAGGTEVGTWVHAVLEHLDFGAVAPKDGRPLSVLVAEQGQRVGIRDPEELARVESSLKHIVTTPLDGGQTGLPAPFRLADIRADGRLDELPFDLCLGKGNRYAHGLAGGCVDPRAVRTALMGRDGDWAGAKWLEHVLTRMDAPSEAGKDGKDRVFPAIAGVLTGFIDLVFRVPAEPAAAEEARYYVADYKTNRIVSPNARRDSLRRHYTQPWLAWAMGHGGYHLQALLYTVALHRLLKTRLGKSRYDYGRHMGGHLYLFVRGMEGPASRPADGLALGVYDDRWPREVVEGFDKALEGATPDEVHAAMAKSARAGGSE